MIEAVQVANKLVLIKLDVKQTAGCAVDRLTQPCNADVLSKNGGSVICVYATNKWGPSPVWQWMC